MPLEKFVIFFYIFFTYLNSGMSMPWIIIHIAIPTDLRVEEKEKEKEKKYQDLRKRDRKIVQIGI